MLSSKPCIVALVLLLFASYASAQSLDVFNTKLHAERITLCDLVNKHAAAKQDFNVGFYDSSFYFLSSYDNHSPIFGNWTFTIRHDSLNQYGFSSLPLPITAEWYNTLYAFADSAIHVFATRYGKPARDTTVIKNRFANIAKHSPGDIRKAMWIIDGQKLKVEFDIGGEHDRYYYSLRIQRFQDYFGNQILPPWWNGY